MQYVISATHITDNSNTLTFKLAKGTPKSTALEELRNLRHKFRGADYDIRLLSFYPAHSVAIA